MENAVSTRADKPRGHRKVRTGVVVSDKMDKTIVVRIERIKLHRKYKKYTRVWKNVKAHDQENSCRTGDLIQIIETRPLSKDKRWRLLKVIRRAD